MNAPFGRLCAWALALGLAPAGAAGPDAAPALYLGYFQEEVGQDRVDPLTGVLYLRLNPAGFDGGLLYALHGCRSGADQARLAGARSGAGLSGAWRGDFDTEPVGGGFAGLAAGPGFGGSYSASAGGRAVDCDGDGVAEYRIAPLGHWRLWPLGEGSIAVKVDARGRLQWRAVVSAHYGLRVFDAGCLRRGDPLARCLRVDDDQDDPAVDPGDWSAALPPRRSYVAVVLAVDDAGRVLGFGSRAFDPR